MQIIQATQSDIPAIVEIWKDFMDYHYALESFFKRAEDGHTSFRKYLYEEIENDDVYLAVAVENDGIVGYILARKAVYPPVFAKTDYCLITDIVLQEGVRGKGQGKLLFDAAVDWAKQKGLDRVELQVVPANAMALRFYRKLGFKEHLSTLALDI